MDNVTISKEICLIDSKDITEHIVKAVKENKVKSVKTDWGTMLLISI